MGENKNGRKQHRSKIKKAISTILVIALVLGAFYAYQQYKAFLNRPTVVLAEAERASFNRTLNLNAQVEALDSQAIMSNYGFTVDKVLVKEGDLVESGQELYRYSRIDVQKQLRQTKDALAKMDKAEEERKERFESVLNDLAAQMSAQFGMSLQSSAALLTQGLSDFDLKGQIQGLLPDGLEEWGLDPSKISTTITSLNNALTAGESTMLEIESLIEQVSYSGISELTAANLYQLLVQSQALYEQVQAILKTANQLLENGLPKDLADLVSDIRDRAEKLEANLAKAIEKIKELLEWTKDNVSPFPPGFIQPDDEFDDDFLDSPSDADIDTGIDENTDPDTNQPEENPDSNNSDNNEITIPEEISDPYNPDVNGPGTVDGINSNNEEVLSPENNDSTGENTNDSSGYYTGDSSGDSTGGGGNPAAEDSVDANPALLLALLQMDQKQGQADRQKLEETKSELEGLLKSNSLTVKADMSGLVASLKVTEGDAIEQGELEALILDNDHLVANCWVGKQDASRLEEGQPVVFHYDDLDLYGEITYKAAIASREPSTLGSLGVLSSQLGLDDAAGLLGSGVGAGSPKVQIRMSIEGPDIHLLTIGFDINCEVEVAKVENVLSIPVEALVQERDHYYVYCVDEDQLLRKQEIELGLVGASRVEIKSGLTEHDPIVVNAMSGLEVGQKVKVKDDK
ncbi:MAG: hypothetical protein Q4E09_02995 [Eubacteriales bacterium]|nr:hypothetical protein [Eubacteriales bacterium]